MSDHAMPLQPAAASASERVVRVRLATPLPHSDGVLDYLPPADAPLPPRGSLVLAPLGKRRLAGVVIGSGAAAISRDRLKPLLAISGLPAMPEDWLQFAERVSRWTMASPGAVLKMMLPVTEALMPPPVVNGLVASCPPDSVSPETLMTAKRRQVLEVAFGMPPMRPAELARRAGVSSAVLSGMTEAGLLEKTAMAVSAGPRPDPHRQGHPLTDAQKTAANCLRKAVREGGFQPFCLDGVTGSGKTEVYLEAVAEALSMGRQALVLLPEIALSPAWEQRFTDRFGAPPLVWHSAIGSGRRRAQWRQLAEGGPQVVVAARSGLFLPLPDAAVIIIDEEHDAGYKQQDGVAYQARDMAVLRARLKDIPVVLASATPSLETEENCRNNRYKRLALPDRVGTAGLPSVSLIDMKKTPPRRGCWLAPPLIAAMQQRLQKKQQVLLFLNRRGYAPLTLCRHCGERLQCHRCDAWLVAHQAAAALQCHHCGWRRGLPSQCPACKAEDSLVACGPGVERLAEEVRQIFPDARQAIMSSDLVPTQQAAAKLVAAVIAGEVDILIGTQMITKGHHFPGLSLVGVVDADMGLAGGDLRAAERTWQMLTQVAGRAGRDSIAGVAMIQSWQPQQAVYRALVNSDRAAFLETERKQRQQAGMPPFGRLATVLLTATSPPQLEQAARQLAAVMPHYEGVSILGPAPAAMARLKGRHRLRFLLSGDREVNIQEILRRWLAAVVLPPTVHCSVDIDPYSLF